MSDERRTARKNRRQRRRVIQTPLPAADFTAPASWDRWEARARHQLDRAAARAAQ